MVLLQFARCTRASAGESLNRTTFPFTTAVACITQANRKQEADKPSRFPSQVNMMLPTAHVNIARHADQSRHGCPTVEVARGRSLVSFSALTIQRSNLIRRITRRQPASCSATSAKSWSLTTPSSCPSSNRRTVARFPGTTLDCQDIPLRRREATASIPVAAMGSRHSATRHMHQVDRRFPEHAGDRFRA